MRAFARRAVAHLGPLGPDDLERHAQTFDAVLWCVSIVGEAAARLSPEAQAELSMLPLQQARRMRNMLIHRYPEIEAHTVVATVRDDFQGLIARLDRLLEDMPG